MLEGDVVQPGPAGGGGVTEKVDEKEHRKAASRSSTKVEVQTSFTQEEILTETIQTELANNRWILTAQRLAREQAAKASRALGRPASSAVRVTSRRNAPATVTFSEVDAQPNVFRFAPEEPPARRRGAVVCAVTGLPAKYLDPVTKKPYANAAAFKKLREGVKNAEKRKL